MTDEERTARLDAANEITKKYVMSAMSAGLIPIPIVDFVAVTGIQVKMLHTLAQEYDIPFSTNLSQSLIGALLGGMIPTEATMTLVGSLSKFIPVGGTTMGMITMSLFSGASTYAVGKVFIQHFEAGGTILTFDPNQVREYFKAELEKGKEQIKQWQSQESNAA
jgi:uncharacterized protein (DUF697 family)